MPGDAFVGAVLDRRYEVVERIAEGGFGAVYRARHVRNGLEVALKILHPKHATDERVVARFRREGEALVSLRSPNTVTTYELVEDGPTLFIVMELLRGQTLRQRLGARGHLTWPEAVGIARAVCDALAEAHGAGIVHRDLKPANIHLGERGTVKVLDFGIAKLVLGSRIADSGEELTRANELVGTLDYVSPEQVAGESYTGQSDIYTLGVVLYEMLTGQRPFGEITGAALLAMMMTSTPEPPSAVAPFAGIPAALDAVVLQCLARDRVKRFGDVGALAEALDLVLEREESVTRAMQLPSARLPAVDVHDKPTTIGSMPIVDVGDEPAPAPDAAPTAQAAPPIGPAPMVPSMRTLEGWVAPVLPPRPATIPPTPIVTPLPPPGARGIPLLVWIVVLLVAIVVGVLLATI